jgi:hypothetical protein
VQCSGCAAFVLGVSFAEALYLLFKFTGKLCPLGALGKEKASDFRVIDLFSRLPESVLAVAARFD